jgi:hypothetical protein
MSHYHYKQAAAGVQAVWRAYSIRQAISMQSKISTFKTARRVLGNSCFRTEVRHGKVQVLELRHVQCIDVIHMYSFDAVFAVCC